MNLSEREIQHLTGQKRHDAQARELDHLGIHYKTRRDGSLVVLRIHVEHNATIEREPRLCLD